MSNQYYIRVYENNEFSYDVGPFSSLDGMFSEDSGAMEWLYQQIGLLKTHYPDEELKKEAWDYQRKTGFMEEYVANIKVHLAHFSFEVFSLKPTSTNVKGELVIDERFPEQDEDK